jgi:hypothetical protein
MTDAEGLVRSATIAGWLSVIAGPIRVIVHHLSRQERGLNGCGVVSFRQRVAAR